MRTAATVYSFIVLVLSAGCASMRDLSDSSSDRHLLKMIREDDAFSDHLTGFALYDPDNAQWLCQYNADKYFTPASNTKILTLYACLNVLGDSIGTLQYRIANDTLFFRGMADPSFLYDKIPSSVRPLDLLRDYHGQVCYETGEEVDRFGPGWSWDDFVYPFQVEKSILPLFGNRVRVTKTEDETWDVIPHYFSDYLESDPDQEVALSRDELANAFVLNEAMMSIGDTVAVPFAVSDFELTRILADTLRKPVCLLYVHSPDSGNTIINGAARDDLLRSMMFWSDNFIAEQLIMQCAFALRGTFNSDSAISVISRELLNDSPDAFHWVDGSGLSRYNLCTPRSLVWVLDQLRRMKTMGSVAGFFPSGGSSGTLAQWYPDSLPYVFAKTGTLRNQGCLSGYLHTDGGKWLIFSFMHNNATGPTPEIRKEMGKVFEYLRAKY